MDKYREQPEALARGNFFTDFSHLDLNKKYQASELLRFLRTKANASDLLETVAQLLELTYATAIEEGNANMEVSMARGGFDTLGNRLNHDLGDENILRLVHQVVSAGDEIFTPVGLEQFMTTQNGVWSI